MAGTVIYGDDFETLEGYICLKDGIIKEISKGKVDADFEGIICPCFINAHTHIGDSVFKDPPILPINEMVGPRGLKHKILAQTPSQLLIEGMRRSILEMKTSGTCAFSDFREGGTEGIQLLMRAIQDIPIEAKIMGRPIEQSKEIPENCCGLGISSTIDYDYKSLREIVFSARKQAQMVAIHAGEASCDDIFDALNLQPDFLVHLCRTEKEHIKKILELDISVVICPRSNLMTGAGLPDLEALLHNGITVGVGTDNVMLNAPDMFSEMNFVYRILLHDDRQVFKMCTLNGAKILGIDHRVGSIYENKEARIMVINRNSNNLWGSSNPLASVVRRAKPSDISAIF